MDNIYLGWASQVVLVEKNPPAKAGDTLETCVWSLGQEDPLEKGMDTHSKYAVFWPGE